MSILLASGSLSFGVTVTSPVVSSTLTAGVCTVAVTTVLPAVEDFCSVSFWEMPPLSVTVAFTFEFD